ncbi:potential E3 ubiquitin-protein ligase ariadne-2-like [Ylistrum balloti]|uniref:potential E3 ubiquitin-protein ligase ariadne-2-like n=1 Tax=Ylistrum balloti TaxID=509963 RepID=UPI0029059EF8|nr:potential E3 ubiquitin-protein ligase ariadne-2-like [Ylistrum balloti]
MAGQFKRLSESTLQRASFIGSNTVTEAKSIVAKVLRQNIYDIEIVENGGIIDGSLFVKDVQNPLQVVIHNTDRQVPLWLQTTKKDMVNPWEEEPRCIMSCNHAITPDNLYGYCWNQLTEQRTSFKCFVDVDGKRCDWEWFFAEVAENACLSTDERVLFESRINRNWFNLSAGVRECPFCRCVCERQRPDDPCVLCIYCRDAGKPHFEFCWYCLYPWKDNHSCTKDSARQILSTCPRKEIVKVPGCPSIRACPNCKILIEHKEQCKHMDCRNCKASFCFICLGVRGERGFTCGSYNSKCAVAPIQTVT